MRERLEGKRPVIIACIWVKRPEKISNFWQIALEDGRIWKTKVLGIWTAKINIPVTWNAAKYLLNPGRLPLLDLKISNVYARYTQRVCPFPVSNIFSHSHIRSGLRCIACKPLSVRCLYSLWFSEVCVCPLGNINQLRPHSKTTIDILGQSNHSVINNFFNLFAWWCHNIIPLSHKAAGCETNF